MRVTSLHFSPLRAPTPATEKDLEWCVEAQEAAREAHAAGNNLATLGLADALLEECLIRQELAGRKKKGAKQ